MKIIYNVTHLHRFTLFFLNIIPVAKLNGYQGH